MTFATEAEKNAEISAAQAALDEAESRQADYESRSKEFMAASESAASASALLSTASTVFTNQVNSCNEITQDGGYLTKSKVGNRFSEMIKAIDTSVNDVNNIASSVDSVQKDYETLSRKYAEEAEYLRGQAAKAALDVIRCRNYLDDVRIAKVGGTT